MKQAGFAPENASLAGKESYREWQFVHLPPDAPMGPQAGQAPAGPPGKAPAQ